MNLKKRIVTKKPKAVIFSRKVDPYAYDKSSTLSSRVVGRRKNEELAKMGTVMPHRAFLSDYLVFRTDNVYSYDSHFVKEFINNKKMINGYVYIKNIEKRPFDTMPKKYFYYKFRRDPIYNSVLLEKVINCFMKDGKKEHIRKIFYDMFTDEKNNYCIDTLYYIIHSLRPSYVNVAVRRGAEFSRVPIKASRLKSTLKAIRFFKLAVLARVNEETLADKIRAEFYDCLFTFGYYNPFHKEYTEFSEKNIHLNNYRTKKIY